MEQDNTRISSNIRNQTASTVISLIERRCGVKIEWQARRALAKQIKQAVDALRLRGSVLALDDYEPQANEHSAGFHTPAKRRSWKEPPVEEPYTFLHRTVPGHDAPLKPGRYVETRDWYDVDRKPRVGESCPDYIDYAKRTGKLTSTSHETLIIGKDA